MKKLKMLVVLMGIISLGFSSGVDASKNMTRMQTDSDSLADFTTKFNAASSGDVFKTNK